MKRARLKPYSVADLEQRWVTGAQIVCLGKAMGAGGLRDRIAPFSRRSSSHSGGRAIWQLRDSDVLLVCWVLTPGYQADRVEDDLIHAFTAAHGQTPFANIRTRGHY